MEITKYISKKTLIYICIIIVILIILRILYSTFYIDSIVEGFDLSNNPATDLLTKYKSNNAQLIVNSTNENLEMKIYSWSNQLYNIQNPSTKSRALAFYKPILTINKVQYAKLGDIVSQNSDYSLPSVDQFTLLVKKGTSDIKSPIRFDLMTGINNPTFDTNFYAYSNYIGSSSLNINSFSESLIKCGSAISNLNSLIQNKIDKIDGIIGYNVYNDINNKISVGSVETPLIELLRKLGELVEGFDNESSDFIPIVPTPLIDTPIIDNSPTIELESEKAAFKLPLAGTDSNIYLPAGITGYIISKGQKIDISINAFIDNSQTKNNTNIINKLPKTPYGNLKSTAVSFVTTTTKIFSCIPMKNIVNYIIELCNDIENIYNQSHPQDLLSYLKLAPTIDIVQSVQLAMVSFANTINSTTLDDFSKQLSDISGLNIASITNTTTLLELVLYVINKMSVTYSLPYLSFKITDLTGIDIYSKIIPKSIGCYKDSTYDSALLTTSDNNRAIPNMLVNSSSVSLQDCANLAQTKGHNIIGLQAGGWCFGGLNPNYTKYGPTADGKCGDLGNDWVNHVYSIELDALTITKFTGNPGSFIPRSAYSVLTNTQFTYSDLTKINSIIANVNNFSKFIKAYSTNSIGYFPLKIYKPIAPDNYVSLGHVFGNVSTDLQKITDSNNVACVPSHCVKPIRDWTTNDKIFEYNQNGTYFGIYLNPYTGTFISTNTNSQTLPEGKVCKVVACVKKCTAVDELEKSDDCARKYYNLNKEAISSTPLSSTLVSSQEEEFYLGKIKVQSDSITRLKQRAQQMQTDVDKATIVNREMNKSKLQNYVDEQKRNIDIIMQRLQSDKNKIKTDINIPADTLKDIMDMIKNSLLLNSEQKTNLLKQLANTQNLSGDQYKKSLNQVLSSCPQYDLTGLVSKQTASDVCFGCDTPM